MMTNRFMHARTTSRELQKERQGKKTKFKACHGEWCLGSQNSGFCLGRSLASHPTGWNARPPSEGLAGKLGVWATNHACGWPASAWSFWMGFSMHVHTQPVLALGSHACAGLGPCPESWIMSFGAFGSSRSVCTHDCCGGQQSHLLWGK